ncbi:M23 family metallopeptidase [Bacteroidota bacterium]
MFIINSAGFTQKLFQKNDYNSPVNLPLFLSGTFGELRSDHFHSGLDVRTDGMEGIEIYSIDDGWVSRIIVAPNGYGNVIFITHPTGFISVYAHLDAYEEKITSFVKNIQYRRHSFSVDIFPERTQFPVSKGDLIGFSGNTGGSEGAHLHFEIRDAGTNNILNPLKYFSNIKDTINPEIYHLAVFPLDKNRFKLSGSYSEVFNIRGNEGKYSITPDKIIKIGGDFGLGIGLYDFFNESWNRCGAYSIELLIDEERVYYHTFDEFSFNETRYLNSLVDYKAWQNNLRLQKSFIEPNNKLSIYNYTKNNGKVSFKDYEVHNGKYIVKDLHGNISILDFLLQKDSTEWNFQKEDSLPESQKKYMTWLHNNTYSNDGFLIDVPGNALYDSILFTYNVVDTTDIFYSPIHIVHNKYVPLHTSYAISIKTRGLPKHLQNKALITGLDEEGEFIPLGGKWHNGFINTRLREFGNFTVIIDTLAPEIIAMDIDSMNNFIDTSEIKFIIKDDLSGIAKFEGKIDGKWVLFEYDQKNDLIIYKFDKEKLNTDIEHQLVLTVTDNKNNVAVFSSKFYK